MSVAKPPTVRLRRLAAELRRLRAAAKLTHEEVIQQTGITRPTIYRWMDDKSLDYVRDDMSGRTFVVRHDVEAMKADMEAAETNGKHEL